MTKVVYNVVYNACYGGFGLSNEAKDRMVELGYEMEINPNYDPRPGVEWYNRTQKYKIYDGDIPRHDQKKEKELKDDLDALEDFVKDELSTLPLTLPHSAL